MNHNKTINLLCSLGHKLMHILTMFYIRENNCVQHFQFMLRVTQMYYSLTL